MATMPPHMCYSDTSTCQLPAALVTSMRRGLLRRMLIANNAPWLAAPRLAPHFLCTLWLANPRSKNLQVAHTCEISGQIYTDFVSNV